MTELSQNPLLSALKLPGRVFPVPSKCNFYKNGEVNEEAMQTGEVQVFSMSGLAEMKFRSPDLLYSGKAVCEVIKECIPAVLKPEKLMSKDVDAFLMYIRLVTYGPALEIKSVHNCENAKEHNYEINLESLVASTKTLSKSDYELHFSVKLPNEQVVILHPLNWEDAVELLQKTASATGSDVDELYTKNTTSIIESVDNITDKKHIEEWARLVMAPYTKKMETAVHEGLDLWGTPTDPKLKCKDCGTEYTYVIDLNPSSFFSQ